MVEADGKGLFFDVEVGRAAIGMKQRDVDQTPGEPFRLSSHARARRGQQSHERDWSSPDRADRVGTYILPAQKAPEPEVARGPRRSQDTLRLVAKRLEPTEARERLPAKGVCPDGVFGFYGPIYCSLKDGPNQ